ncbi:hypothetical protein [Prescottella subtropica]|uniref:hypothetical protein n=1 Tax=Prescottella subtropica TaxID=2545757 RepID=UPI0010F9C684|nr:hypothetical protein [Prescottella subtropica]
MERHSTELRSDGTGNVAVLLWWATLLVVVAAVPAVAALVFMGSALVALTTGLITAGGVGLAALLI